MTTATAGVCGHSYVHHRINTHCCIASSDMAVINAKLLNITVYGGKCKDPSKTVERWIGMRVSAHCDTTQCFETIDDICNIRGA